MNLTISILILIKERWGTGVVKQLSLDLRRDFPDADGFSVSNLWFMKKWYCFYTQKEAVQKLQRAVGELESEKLQQPVRELDEAKSSRLDREKLQQPVREFEKTKLHQAGAEMPAFFAGVPWGHHIAIITKCKSVDEALFYIKKTVEQGMSTSTCKGYLQVVHERAAKMKNSCFYTLFILYFVVVSTARRIWQCQFYKSA